MNNEYVFTVVLYNATSEEVPKNPVLEEQTFETWFQAIRYWHDWAERNLCFLKLDTQLDQCCTTGDLFKSVPYFNHIAEIRISVPWL